MAGSFNFVKAPGKKISLEQTGHPCPGCKQSSSVRLTRSERQWILFNKCISNVVRVRYECSQCKWRNEELPFDTTTELLEDTYYYHTVSPSTISLNKSHTTHSNHLIY
ncbi:hypothetical protein G6F57_001903 [Rhizopus arrhizus]|uniref:Uncharacterized protein n=1 Tax=Rhizopus oryzae TaxID=64495 RepID=A0A9P7BVC4_RHIOR|nr:hypothetical protein G6F23_001251 [Rhizopus arrhizus]KAG1224275.1 hypothetical protein G6F68_020151 [Rhizopus microsporus]KAG1410312.1 hypothetical protein G6F58_009219 [Rhizopus delemar]KAG0768805.1 hypothetical protein G6F24_001620 [Rhizopus arrhizus]KAG0797178.1 hypothetical protein G6F21_000716 [Rhizopus arrhizus]